MSQQSDTLNQILVDVVANRKNLAAQIDTQKQQVEVGIAQLAKFDVLIATLQVTLDSDDVLAAAATQEAANATVSPTGAGPEAANTDVPPASEPAQASA
jgi:hypothetical protein